MTQELLEILTQTKWNILEVLAIKPQSPTELAAILKTSTSNCIQQLKLLEAHNLVETEKESTRSVGKPRTIYHIKQEFIHLIMIRSRFTAKKTIMIDERNVFMYNLLFINPDDMTYVLRFTIANEEILKKCKAIAYVKSGKESVELFLVSEHTDEIRAKFSNVFIQDYSGKTKKIVNWTHNEQEITEGLARKDKYFVDFFKQMMPLHDPQKIIEKQLIR